MAAPWSTPAVKMVDINFKNAVRARGMRLEPRLDVYNLFNASAPTIRIAQLGPTYLQPTEILGARLVKLGANVSW